MNSLAEHTALEGKRGKKLSDPKGGAKGGGSKVAPDDPPSVSSNARKETDNGPTNDEIELLKPLNIICGGGLCSGPPDIVTIKGEKLKLPSFCHIVNNFVVQ